MWSPIPRMPTSCVRSTWSPPNIRMERRLRPLRAGGACLSRHPRRTCGVYCRCGGRRPAANLNGGTLLCVVVTVRTAIAAVAAAGTVPIPGTAGSPPCPPSPSCPSFPAAARLPTPVGPCMSPSPRSFGILRAGRTRTPPAAAAAAAADCPAAPAGAATYNNTPHSRNGPPGYTGRPGAVRGALLRWRTEGNGLPRTSRRSHRPRSSRPPAPRRGRSPWYRHPGDSYRSALPGNAPAV